MLVWTSTGLAGLLAHGSWPTGVSFSHTPLAMHHLIAHPHDVPGAWPQTPRAQLSGYGLLWGLFIGQLMVLFVLVIFAIGTLARWRAHRALQRRTAHAGRRVPGRAATPEAEALGRTSKTVDAPAQQPTPAPTDPTAPAHASPTADVPAKTPDTSPAPAQDAAPVPATAAQATVDASPTAPDTSARTLGDGPSLAKEQPAADPSAGLAGFPLPSPRTPFPHAPGAPTPSHDLGTQPSVFIGTPDARRPIAVQAVADATGPALVITSDPSIWVQTKDARAKLGPVLLYDPTHRCDTPARLHWSPSAGCTDRDTAAERARALLAPVRPTAKIDTAVADTAETLLRCFLHAAAVDGRQFRHVHRWAQGTQVQDAVRTLRSHPKAASGTAGELEAALTAHPERRDIAQELTARALSALSSVHIRDACTPNRADTATLDSFLTEGGTLYLVGEAVEDPKSRPGAMPLLTALASSVVEHGRRMAERSSSGRLDPPLTLVLEDVAAVAPLPQLPALLATGTGTGTGTDRGMPTLVLLRSREQARTRWPHANLPL
nr:type VI secretion protein [Streptomyces sp. ODS25]